MYLSNDGLSPTGIGSVGKAVQLTGGRIYSLDGREVRTDGRSGLLPHGIYIKNGKKVKM